MSESQSLVTNKSKNDEDAIRCSGYCILILCCILIPICIAFGITLHNARSKISPPSPPSPPQTPNERNFTIRNKCKTSLYINVEYENQYIQWHARPGQENLIYVPIISNGYIFAFANRSTIIPYTRAYFSLGNSISNSMDTYGADFAHGYNVPVSISPNYTFIEYLMNEYKFGIEGNLCWGENWTNIITKYDCPEELRATTNGEYIGCHNPCDVFHTSEYCCMNTCYNKTCEKNICHEYWCNGLNWPVSYINTFDNACSNCSLTKCDFGSNMCSDFSNIQFPIMYAVPYIIDFC